MEETLIPVDENDNEIGRETREKCRFGKGRMHKALVTFLFNKRRTLLIQQRSQRKRLWLRYWDCTVAKHVCIYETYETVVQRALKKGITNLSSCEKSACFHMCCTL